MLHAKGSLSSVEDGHGMHRWNPYHVGHNLTSPVLDALGRNKVEAGHLGLLLKDRDRLERVARMIRCGGWSLTEMEARAFDVLGESRMHIADQVTGLWERRKATLQMKSFALPCDMIMAAPERLVFILGLPLMEMYEKICQHPLISHRLMTEKVLPQIKKWEKEYEPAQAGYHLIRPLQYQDKIRWNEESHGRNITREETLEVIDSIEPAFQYASPALVLEAMISHLYIVGYSEKVDEDTNVISQFSHRVPVSRSVTTVAAANFVGCFFTSDGGGETFPASNRKPKEYYLAVMHYPWNGWSGNTVISRKL
ncbi:MAG: hypothetical protein V4467_03970 [Patescibacteria group bacterium]